MPGMRNQLSRQQYESQLDDKMQWELPGQRKQEVFAEHFLCFDTLIVVRSSQLVVMFCAS